MTRIGLRSRALWIAASMAVLVGAVPFTFSADWRTWGQNQENTRNQDGETRIGAANAKNLVQKWAASVGGDVSSTPATEDGAVYVTDWSGGLTRLRSSDGGVVWSRKVSSYTGIANDFARTTPAIVGDLLIFGDQAGHELLGNSSPGASVIAVNKNTGAKKWAAVVDRNLSAVITQSASVNGGTVYVGVSSREEFRTIAVTPGGPGPATDFTCCSFRGSVVALDASSGRILWKTPTISDAAFARGYRGSSVWGSAPVVDTKRGTLYVATGNNYRVPDAVAACVRAAATDAAVQACTRGDQNYFDAIVALDLRSGRVKWWNSLVPFDAYTIVCDLAPFLPPPVPPNCQFPERALDLDFAQAPMLFSASIDGRKRDLIGAAQKSGTFWALDPDDGKVKWSKVVGPGGHLGGSMWGSATDGRRIYVAISNGNAPFLPPTPSNPLPTPLPKQGYWVALDPGNGNIQWMRDEPNPPVAPTSLFDQQGNWAMSPLSVANGVLYAASLAPGAGAATMFAIDAASGVIQKSFASGASVLSGPSIASGRVYWGSGYTGGILGLGKGTPPDGKQVFAFGLP